MDWACAGGLRAAAGACRRHTRAWLARRGCWDRPRVHVSYQYACCLPNGYFTRYGVERHLARLDAWVNRAKLPIHILAIVQSPLEAECSQDIR